MRSWDLRDQGQGISEETVVVGIQCMGDVGLNDHGSEGMEGDGDMGIKEIPGAEIDGEGSPGDQENPGSKEIQGVRRPLRN